MNTTETWTENLELARKLTASRPNINYFEDKVPQYELPKLLVDDDGTPVTTVEQWRKRRAKLLELFRN